MRMCLPCLLAMLLNTRCKQGHCPCIIEMWMYAPCLDAGWDEHMECCWNREFKAQSSSSDTTRAAPCHPLGLYSGGDVSAFTRILFFWQTQNKCLLQCLYVFIDLNDVWLYLLCLMRVQEAAPMEDVFNTQREEQQRRWLQELDRQREEAKLRRQQDKEINSQVNSCHSDSSQLSLMSDCTSVKKCQKLTHAGRLIQSFTSSIRDAFVMISCIYMWHWNGS